MNADVGVVDSSLGWTKDQRVSLFAFRNHVFLRRRR